MSSSASATDLHSEKVLLSSSEPDWRASLTALTQSLFLPGPKVKSASSIALISLSIQPSRRSLSTLARLVRRFAARVSRSLSLSEDE